MDSTDTHRELLKAVITASIGDDILLRLYNPLPGMPIPLFSGILSIGIVPRLLVAFLAKG